MKVADIPHNEQQRLDTLRKYNVLDTLPEQQLDDLTFLAATICGTEIALISLVDKNRQWFKSKVGLDASETSRDIAFCSHAILEQDVFLVEDTSKDQRFFDNPLVTSDPNIKFYAGAPLNAPNGDRIGTLCVIDSRPKHLDEQQIEALEALSRQVIAQLELTKNNIALQDTKKTLETTVVNLKDMSTYKNHFINSVSHEIRTPLNGILGLSKMLTDAFANRDFSEDTSTMLELMQSSAENLADMVNHILDLSQLESGKLTNNQEPVQLAYVFDEIIRTNWPRASKKDLNISYKIQNSMPHCVSIDRIKLIQILMNLVGNAVKFTPPNKNISMLVSQADRQMSIQISDQGVGIDKQHIEKLFKPFQQIEGAGEEQYVGSGLGLTITKELVEFLNGSIQVESTLGVGTCFTVLLPLIEANECVVEPTLNDGIPDYSGKKILVVEDNKVNQLVIKATLAKFKSEFLLAASGQSGVDLALEQQPDLILCDIRLPDFDGFEVIAQLQDHPAGKNIPIAILSADISNESQYKAEKLSVIKFLKKPLDEFELRGVLKSVFNA